jgi:MFS family permease
VTLLGASNFAPGRPTGLLADRHERRRVMVLAGVVRAVVLGVGTLACSVALRLSRDVRPVAYPPRPT